VKVIVLEKHKDFLRDLREQRKQLQLFEAA